MTLGLVVSTASVVPVLIGLVYMHKIGDPVVRTFFYYWMAICFIEGLAYVSSVRFKNNLFVYNYFIHGSFLFAAYAGFKEKWRFARLIFWIAFPVLLTLHVLYFLEFNRYFYFISFLAQMIIMGGLLLKMVDYEDDLHKNPRFFLYASIMIYAASTSATLLIPEVASSQLTSLFYNFFKLALTLLSYFLFCLAFYVGSRR